MKKWLYFIIFSFINNYSVWSAPAVISPFIKIDQFGYLCDAKKTAVISDPINGFNAAESFTPGSIYEVRTWNGDQTVYSGSITTWNGGATHAHSGDRGWHFDFSDLNESGIYYVYDVQNNVGSGAFGIGANVYAETLKSVLKTYYYQRCNFAKTTPYAASEYTDAAAYEGSNQDRHARSRWAKTDASTERDVSGGWFDAGDMNKYVTFACLPVLTLLDAYQYAPQVFDDQNNIPESGNTIPDIIDEIKYELDWLMKMQDGTGTNGIFLKVGVDNYSCVNSPPSADMCARYYLPECTSSTISGAAMFAYAYTIFRNIEGLEGYAANLLQRSEAAYSRALVTTSNFTSFETGCDDGDIKSGDADMDETTQRQYLITAAIYLYSATNNVTYKNFVESNFAGIEPISSWWWGPYAPAYGRALLYFTTLPGVNTSAINQILNIKANSETGMGLTQYLNNDDLYLSHMPEYQYHWGSNQVKAQIGSQQIEFIQYNLNTSNHRFYYELASQYLHYFHGLNPLRMTFLSNMYNLNGENCANEIYHGWFGDGTDFDNALTSEYGPPPGYITGGSNYYFSIGWLNPPTGQPPQKSYKDWNTAWGDNGNEASWEITEPSIYVQAAYINLVARLLASSDLTTCENAPLALNESTYSVKLKNNKVEITWSDESDAKYYEIQRSATADDFKTVTTVKDQNLNTYQLTDKPDKGEGNYYYRIKTTKTSGQASTSSVKQIYWTEGGIKSVYFDPNQKVIHVEFDHMQTYTDVFVQMFDQNGKEVYSKRTGGAYNLSIPANHLSPGSYILFLKNKNGQSLSKKVVIY